MSPAIVASSPQWRCSGYAMYAGVRDQEYGLALLAGLVFAAAGSLLQERISGAEPVAEIGARS
jgi:hypothetical protein